MVVKSKGGKKSRSVISGKKKKNTIKYNRKENYKKHKKIKNLECCVCMESINDISDNIVMCGKVKHPLCGECKLKEIYEKQGKPYYYTCAKYPNAPFIVFKQKKNEERLKVRNDY